MKYDLKNKIKVQNFDEYANQLKIKGATVELREIRLKRSLDSNALYWLWLSALSFETGYDKDDLHRLYRANYLMREDYEIESIVRPELWAKMKKEIQSFNHFAGLEKIIDLISQSTTEQDTLSFSNYLKNIQKHARANFGVILVNLDEANFKDFYSEYGFY